MHVGCVLGACVHNGASFLLSAFSKCGRRSPSTACIIGQPSYQRVHSVESAVPTKVDRFVTSWPEKRQVERRRGWHSENAGQGWRSARFRGSCKDAAVWPQRKAGAGASLLLFCCVLASNMLRPVRHPSVGFSSCPPSALRPRDHETPLPQIKERWRNQFNPTTSFKHYTAEEDAAILSLRAADVGSPFTICCVSDR